MDFHEFKASLAYMECSKPVKATYLDTISTWHNDTKSEKKRRQELTLDALQGFRERGTEPTYPLEGM